jgi:opacity protein-like surface antigen
VVTTNVKGDILTGRVQPWLTIGSGFIDTEYTHNLNSKSSPEIDRRVALAWRYGAGTDFYLTKNAVLQIKADYLVAPTTSQSMVSIGAVVQYRF